MSYKRQRTHKVILDALNSVGGTASRDQIKKIIELNPLNWRNPKQGVLLCFQKKKKLRLFVNI